MAEKGLTQRIYRQRREATEPRIQTALPASVHRLAKSRAALRGQTLTTWLGDAIRHYIEATDNAKR